jgi:hypothetical protein
MFLVRFIGALLWLSACACLLRAEIININSASAFIAALSNAEDGDEIVLQPRLYAGPFFASGLTGVTIRSADPNNPAVIEGSLFGEGLKLERADRVTISDLIIQNATQNGISIDDGGFVSPSTNITLRNLVIRNGRGHGIKFSGVDHFLIDRVTVTDWGTGFAGINLLGAHDGLVQNSLIQRTNTSGGFGIKAEAGSADVTIRANRFVESGERAIQFGGGVGPSVFRPQPPGDVAAENIVAEGNVIVDLGAAGSGIRAAVAYINVNGSTFRNNLIDRPRSFVGRILKEITLPEFVDTQNGVFKDNITVWHEGDIIAAFNVGMDSTLPETFYFEGNTWFNATNPANSMLTLPAPETGGVYGVDPQVGPDSVIPWQFDWGIWLVNATDQPQELDLGTSSLLLATPNEGAELDLGSPDPLIGNWTLAPLVSTVVQIDPFSQLVLVEAMVEPLAGDYNANGVVDAADYTIWRQTLGSMSDLRADGDNSGTIDQADHGIWMADFGAMAASGSALQSIPGLNAVPEQSTFALLAVVLLACSVALRGRIDRISMSQRC